MTKLSRRILVVEDDVLVRSALTINLGDFGFAVEEAGSIGEALDLSRRLGAELGAAIVDMGLPDGDGESLVADLRAALPNLPIVITSGRGPDEIRPGTDRLLAVVAKPYEVEGIVRMVEAMTDPGG
jgi:DNA-binding response OmpR family regulator